jgi:hypothetical protein
VSVVVRKEGAEYAFHRGTAFVGQPPAPAAQPQGAPRGQAEQAGKPGDQNQALDANLKMQNYSNTARQIQRLQERYQRPAPRAPKGAAAGGFR